MWEGSRRATTLLLPIPIEASTAQLDVSLTGAESETCKAVRESLPVLTGALTPIL